MTVCDSVTVMSHLNPNSNNNNNNNNKSKNKIENKIRKIKSNVYNFDRNLYSPTALSEVH